MRSKVHIARNKLGNCNYFLFFYSKAEDPVRTKKQMKSRDSVQCWISQSLIRLKTHFPLYICSSSFCGRTRSDTFGWRGETVTTGSASTSVCSGFELRMTRVWLTVFWWSRFCPAGPMVLHFMLPDTRETYELEKLWTLRSYDEQLNRIPRETLPSDFIYDMKHKWCSRTTESRTVQKHSEILSQCRTSPLWETSFCERKCCKNINSDLIKKDKSSEISSFELLILNKRN